MATNTIIVLKLEEAANRLRSDGTGLHEIARRLSTPDRTISYDCVRRYFVRKPAASIAAAAARDEVLAKAADERIDAVAQLRRINEDTLKILKDAKKADPRLALKAIARLERQLELEAKLLGDLPTGNQVNVTIVQTEFAAFRAALIEVMCPACKQRVLERIGLVGEP